jgi:hypothetical protein
MDLQVILGIFGHWQQGGLWLTSLKTEPAAFAPSLGHKSNTPRQPRTR